MTKLTNETITEIIRLHGDEFKYTVQEIGQETGVSLTTIYRKFREWNLTPNIKDHTHPQEEKILIDYQDHDIPVDVIFDTYKITQTYLYNLIRRRGIKSRQRSQQYLDDRQQRLNNAVNLYTTSTLSVNEITLEYNIPVSTFYTELTKRRVPRRSRFYNRKETNENKIRVNVK